jgi:filamentous hemagglutinin
MFKDQRPGAFAPDSEKSAFNAKVLAYSKLVSGAVAAYAGGNAQTAITTSEVAVANNFLTYNRQSSRASQWGSFKRELDSCKVTAGCDVSGVYNRWTAISNEQQGQAMASMDALFAANPSEASTAGQWFGKAVSSMYMDPRDVCSTSDTRCYSFVQSQQNQARAVYATGLSSAYANDLIDGGGRLRSSLLEAPTGVSKTLGVKGEVIPVAGTKVVAQYGPLNAGPLPSDVAYTFRSGAYAEVLTQQPTILYRVYGGSANEMGKYWTTKTPAGPVQSIIDSALNPRWGNTATNVVKIEVPAGVKFYQGAAAPQGGLVGGGDQVVLPPGFKIDPSWKR